MAQNVTIHEFSRQAVDARGYPVPVGQFPALAIQTKVSDATSDTFAAFNALTTFIMVKTEAVTSIAIGVAPTAVIKAAAGNLRMAADETQYFGVIGGHIMAIITDT